MSLDPAWLYRVLENDDDGDPLDSGVVTATALDAAVALVTAHLTDVLEPEADIRLPVRFYPVLSREGVWTTGDPQDVTISLEGVA